MIIIYNPEDGAPISGFIFNHIMLDTHYPDGYNLPDGSVSNGLAQYEDFAGQELLETYQFLNEITAERAQEILERPQEPKYKCDFPGCDFSTHTKVALSGHKRSHAKALAGMKEPVVSPSLIPVMGGKKVVSLAEQKQMMDNEQGSDIPSGTGTDRDGVGWYGDGVTVEKPVNPGFGGVRQTGKGHFVG